MGLGLRPDRLKLATGEFLCMYLTNTMQRKPRLVMATGGRCKKTRRLAAIADTRRTRLDALLI